VTQDDVEAAAVEQVSLPAHRRTCSVIGWTRFAGRFMRSRMTLRTMNRAVIYVRVSDQKQVDNTSLASQEAKGPNHQESQFAPAHYPIKVYKTFVNKRELPKRD
jgi:hypothetical protein